MNITCAQCQKEFQIPPSRRKYRKYYRKYCSNTCRGMAHTTDISRTCNICGVPLVRRRDKSGRLESTTKFRTRKYCSYECYWKAPQNWHNNHHLQMTPKWEGWQIAKEFEG